MKKAYISILGVLLATSSLAEIPVTRDWAYEHPLATQIIQRLNSETNRAENEYNRKALTKDQAQKILDNAAKIQEKLKTYIEDNRGKDISQDQNIFLNGQCNLIYNKNVQDLSDNQPDWDDNN